MSRNAQSILKSLQQERERLMQERKRIEAADAAQSQRDESGELSDYTHHPADSASATYDRERDSALLLTIEGLLEKVDRAIEKIQEGSYGVCDRCGEEIAAARLLAMPAAALCLKCQNMEDQL